MHINQQGQTVMFTTVENVSHSLRFRQILVDFDVTFTYKYSNTLTCTVLYCCIQHQTLLRSMMPWIQKNGNDSLSRYMHIHGSKILIYLNRRSTRILSQGLISVNYVVWMSSSFIVPSSKIMISIHLFSVYPFMDTT